MIPIKLSKNQRMGIICIALFIGLNIYGNTVAMNYLASHTSIPITQAFTKLSIGIYLNPTSFMQLYITYGKVATSLFDKASLIYFSFFTLSILIPIGMRMLFSSKEYTSEGTARWATKQDLIDYVKNGYKLPDILVRSKDTNEHSGVIVGSWYNGLVNYETLYNTMRKIEGKFKSCFNGRFAWSDKTFWNMMYHAQSILGVSREYITDDFPTHLFLCAPSRSGKGIGPIISTLLHWKDSMIVTDLKRENTRETGAYRKHCLGHTILEFAPTDARPTARFNPVNEIRWGTEKELDDVKNIVILLVGEPEGKDAHWKSTAISLIVGTLIHLKYQHARTNAKDGKRPSDEGYIETSMYHVYEFLSVNVNDKGESVPFADKLKEELAKKDHFPARLFVHNETSDLAMIQRDITKEIAKQITTFTPVTAITPTKHPDVVSSFSSFIGTPPNEAGSILSTAIDSLSIFKSKLIVENTSASDFIIGDIRRRKHPTDLFLVVPPSDLSRVARIFSLIFQVILQRCMEDETKAKQEHRTLLLMDEWPAFGKMTEFVRQLGYMASYGLKSMLIAQGLDQVDRVYEGKIDFLSNCSTKIFFASQDTKTPKYVSELLGKETILVKQESGNTGLFSKKSITKIEKGRFLLTPDEFSALGNKAVIFIEGMKVLTTKTKWFINHDLVYRLNKGKELDPYTLIGIRDEVAANNNPLDIVRFFTPFEHEYIDEEGNYQEGDIADALRLLIAFDEDDYTSLSLIRDLIRFTHLRMTKLNYDAKRTRSHPEYQSVNLTEISNLLAASIPTEVKSVTDELLNFLTTLLETEFNQVSVIQIYKQSFDNLLVYQPNTEVVIAAQRAVYQTLHPRKER